MSLHARCILSTVGATLTAVTFALAMVLDHQRIGMCALSLAMVVGALWLDYRNEVRAARMMRLIGSEPTPALRSVR